MRVTSRFVTILIISAVVMTVHRQLMLITKKQFFPVNVLFHKTWILLTQKDPKTSILIRKINDSDYQQRNQKFNCDNLFTRKTKRNSNFESQYKNRNGQRY